MLNILQPMPRYALRGRVVTMDDKAHILDNGIVYVDNGHIADVTEAGVPAPDDFKHCLQVNTCGTIYPGLIELHNHLSYNILPLWTVPKVYENRAQWAGTDAKCQHISGPMRLLNDAGGYLAAIIRYVEAKCLLAGVTTSQGITLVNAAKAEKKYRGIVRNAEEPDNETLPKASHRIGDIDHLKAPDFLSTLKKQKGCFLLHLSEGVDDVARRHFLDLEYEDHTAWAITNALVGIHAAGLESDDFVIFKQFGGSMVWSPLSNLLLYGATAKVEAAKRHNVPIALGSDWSPSGSKNLLGELKIAWLYSQMSGDSKHSGLFTDVEIVRMVTSTPAHMLKWGDALGSLEPSKIADLVVVNNCQGDPYRKLFISTEADISLVVIGGIPRCGTPDLMLALDQTGETWQIGTEERLLNLCGAPDAEVSALTLKQAQGMLKEGLNSLPNPPAMAAVPIVGAAPGDATPVETWRLMLDNDGEEARESRALGPLTTAEVINELWAVADLHELVGPLELDELTVAETPGKYCDLLAAQPNLPDPIKDGLPSLYGI
jgi:5-methylthioadenosine/S-adenosylhomocysteine deaminase